MESRLRQSAFSRMVLATASALSMVFTAAQVKDSRRAASSCVCKRSIAGQLQMYMLPCTMSLELARAWLLGSTSQSIHSFTIIKSLGTLSTCTVGALKTWASYWAHQNVNAGLCTLHGDMQILTLCEIAFPENVPAEAAP